MEKLLQLPGFVISAAEAEAMMREVGVDTAEELLPALVPAAQRLARPPISNFPVGAVGLGSSGRIYIGVNVEFPGVPLHHSIHAEQFLVVNAAAHGEPKIEAFAVSANPCGHCRQFLQEIRNASEIRVLVTADGAAAAFRPLSEFLPRAFGPSDLLTEDSPLLLEPHCNVIGDLEGEGKLAAAAEAAARGAHAPYSGSASGAAVEDGEGRVYAGGYVESAAYNPGVGPVQAAVVAYVAAGGGGMGEIAAAALVEEEGAAVSHEGTARVLLAAVAPTAKLAVYGFRRQLPR